ncbi:MAG: hypothetical protein ACXIVE_10395 [Salinarimonas sp.]
MAYRVNWCLVAQDERIIDHDRFSDRFADQDSAISFIFDRLGEAPCIGFDAERRHWWIRATTDAVVETRLWVARTLPFAWESEDAMDIV